MGQSPSSMEAFTLLAKKNSRESCPHSEMQILVSVSQRELFSSHQLSPLRLDFQPDLPFSASSFGDSVLLRGGIGAAFLVVPKLVTQMAGSKEIQLCELLGQLTGLQGHAWHLGCTAEDGLKLELEWVGLERAHLSRSAELPVSAHSSASGGP